MLLWLKKEGYMLLEPEHMSRRIDNQLRGRAGRQGDPGSSRFSFRGRRSVETFGSKRISGIWINLVLKKEFPDML